MADRCYARTCGTCWACLAAIEQLGAVAQRDRDTHVAQLTPEGREVYKQMRASGSSHDVAIAAAQRWFGRDGTWAPPGSPPP